MSCSAAGLPGQGEGWVMGGLSGSGETSGWASEQLFAAGKSQVKNQEPLQLGMSKSCVRCPLLQVPRHIWEGGLGQGVAPGAGGCQSSACRLPESFATRSRLFNQASAICYYCLYKNNKPLQIFITISCAEGRVPCIRQWKATPKQLPVSDEAESETRLTWQGRGRGRCCPGSSRRRARPCGVLGSRVGW